MGRTIQAPAPTGPGGFIAGSPDRPGRAPGRAREKAREFRPCHPPKAPGPSAHARPNAPPPVGPPLPIGLSLRAFLSAGPLGPGRLRGLKCYAFGTIPQIPRSPDNGPAIRPALAYPRAIGRPEIPRFGNKTKGLSFEINADSRARAYGAWGLAGPVLSKGLGPGSLRGPGQYSPKGRPQGLARPGKA
jgi:hypothetical protein